MAQAGGVAALTSSSTLGLGSALTVVGLGGVTEFLGIAPVVTILGLTPIGWVVAGTATAVTTSLAYYFTRKVMRQINEERAKGRLEPTTVRQILKETREFKAESFRAILERLSEETSDVSLSSNQSDVAIHCRDSPLKRLKYVVNDDGSEEIVYSTKFRKRERVYLVKQPTKSDDSADTPEDPVSRPN